MKTNDLPLAGIRIVDFTLFWAGPLPTAIFADLGAEVLKVESIQHLDPFRAYGTPGNAMANRGWEKSPLYNSGNRNKRSVTLDLAVADGRALFEQLVAKSDAVLQNYSPRVLPQLGLGYERLCEVNPRIVLTSISGFGQNGPWRDYVSFAAIGEAVSGASSVTGYRDEGALIHGVGVSDPYAGLNAAFATLAAIRAARRRGRGAHLDVSQLEASLPFVADGLLDWAMNGRRRERQTNEDPACAPRGAFPARGRDEDDHWMVLSIGSDEEWRALVDVMGSPAWSREERFATPLRRFEHRAALADRVSTWTRTVDKHEAAKLLQSRGVRAAPVLSPAEQIERRRNGLLQWVDHELAGRHPYVSSAARVDGAYPPIRHVGPMLGADNRYVLGEILGLDDGEIRRLEETQVIGNTPVGAS